jgi:hypothetical protein
MGWVVSFTPRSRFSPGERTPGTHCAGGWVDPRAGLDTEARGKILCLCRGSNLDRPVVQPVARHYTDWATRLTLWLLVAFLQVLRLYKAAPYVVVERLTLLLRIREVPGSNFGPETDYLDWGFSSVPVGKCRNIDLKVGHDHFQILSNSSFTYRPFIRRYIVWVILEVAVK